jgi:hypothetical protein
MPRYKIEFVSETVEEKNVPLAIIEAAIQLRDLWKAPLPTETGNYLFVVADVFAINVTKLQD